MSLSSSPVEVQRFRRSQTPESPRPVHIPEPAKIPVLMNQMDPVFNDTTTYDIPINQNFSPYTESLAEQGLQDRPMEDHDPVQSFFREAENQTAADSVMTTISSDVPLQIDDPVVHPFIHPISGLSEASSNTTQATIDVKETDTDMQTAPDNQSQSTVTDGQTSEHPSSLAQNVKHNTGERQEEQTDIAMGKDLTSQPPESEGGVDYQSLLDTITQSASTAPTAEGLVAPSTAPVSSQEPTRLLPTVPGLPAKPPPQEHPIDFPSFSYAQHTQEQRTGNPSDQNMSVEQGSGQYIPFSAEQPGGQSEPKGEGEHSLSVAGFTQPILPPQPPISLAPGQTAADFGDLRRSQDPSERPWTPTTQGVYDRFLEDERRYVTEGIWDKFPLGSRLFVGNLPSEKVTKRDLFHTFHKYGQLAQVSIKQAYGFVQFLEADACKRALDAEQGVEIRGRKVHLEISKPQKNTKNANSGNNAKPSQVRRRSRSPDRGARRNYSDFRDESTRRRDEYRSRRSPSPRGYRSRNEFRPESRDSRSPSGYGSSYGPPSGAVYDDDASLPLARRDPRSVPDVQVLVLEPDVEQSFINWVEQAFRARGLQTSTTWLNARLPLAAVVKRQIVEGVQAVIKLTRSAQGNSKIPLQVFDRSGGASNVGYQEYADLEPHVAASVVVSARAKERNSSQAYRPNMFPPGPPPPPLPPYPATGPYGQPAMPMQYPAPIPPPIPAPYPAQIPAQPAYPYPPQAGYRAPSVPQPQTPTQPPNLQQLLANLRQPSAQQGPQAPQATPNGVYGNGQAPTYAYPQSPAPQQQYQYGTAQAGQGYNGVPQQQGQQQQQSMQNVMDQLAQYRR